MYLHAVQRGNNTLHKDIEIKTPPLALSYCMQQQIGH